MMVEPSDAYMNSVWRNANISESEYNQKYIIMDHNDFFGSAEKMICMLHEMESLYPNAVCGTYQDWDEYDAHFICYYYVEKTEIEKKEYIEKKIKNRIKSLKRMRTILSKKNTLSHNDTESLIHIENELRSYGIDIS